MVNYKRKICQVELAALFRLFQIIPIYIYIYIYTSLHGLCVYDDSFFIFHFEFSDIILKNEIKIVS